MDDFIKFLMFLGALYGAYQSAKTAWRLGADLLS
jgi:hypothetical protein